MSRSLPEATLSARQRTGDDAIAVTVKRGQFRVQRVTYPDGKRSKIEPLSGWMTLADTIGYLDAMTWND